MAALSIITAILGFAFVIFIHELGHFLFAKWAGVKVERFSIGMGPIIWSRTIGETEYALSILPIGGYVKMLGQEDMPGHHVEVDDERSYSNKHPGWRAAILFGGVLFNIVSSYIILLCLAWYGMPVFNPQIGMVHQHVIDQNGDKQVTPAWEHNLRVGDEILTINGNKVRSYTDLMMYTIADNTEPITLELRRQNGEEYQVEMNGVYDRSRGTHTLGIDLPRGLRVGQIVHIKGEEPALKTKDRIVGIVGHDENFDDINLVGNQLYSKLSSFVGKNIDLRVERDGVIQDVSLQYAGRSMTDIVAPSTGMLPYVAKVMEDSPAERAGILAGDYIYSVNDVRLINTSHINGLIRDAAAAGDAIKVTVNRFVDGAWTQIPLDLDTTIDPRTGNTIIGVIQSMDMAGPLFPGLSEEQTATLQAAGLSAHDIIVDRDMHIVDDRELGEVKLLNAGKGELFVLPYTEAHEKELYKKERLGFFAKLFGVQAKPSIISRLYASRVVKAASEEDSEMVVERLISPVEEQNDDDRKFGVSLVGFEPEQRSVFYDMQQGDIILSKQAYASDGAPAFMILRGADAAAMRWVDVPIQNAGAVLSLMPDERPYELESWTEAFTMANESCKNIVVTTLNIIPRFFKKPEDGGIDATKSLSGPIGIFTGMKQKTEHFGFASFLRLLAFIGINLFLVNLLPIPIVDGGQLVFLAIEVIIRRPVPVVVVEAANWIGFLLIVSLMIFILGIDIDRHFLQ